MELDSQTLKHIVRAVIFTYDNEITCSECFMLIDRYVDLELEGKSAAEAYPLVKAHLDICRDCREEYQALLDALGAML